ncbi:MAG: TIGR04282 family arsenosugar biosynthesis glycosyltransferase, partial [Nitrospirae bacterium]|nr:TIGR04282 family arsenosugar biosynthesis glycosyltransferase [Nitrospirota bacterium]
MKKALIIFVKAPVAGQVKTRLQPYLPADKTAELYKSFISVIVSKCVGMKGIDVFLACAPTKDNDFLKEVSIKYRIKSFNQRGKDLGEKMVNAFRDHHKKGYKEILIIGSDSPTIPKGFIRKAFSELSKNDFVIGPCCDGGFYLAG